MLAVCRLLLALGWMINIGAMPLPLASPQVGQPGTNDGLEAAGLHIIGPSQMQAYELQPLFPDVLDMDLSALSHFPSALVREGDGHSSQPGGENSGETPQ